MSYISDHPTNFNFSPTVQRVVTGMQKLWPWLTYINTYWWHPPYSPPAITFRYDPKSLDVWGGGRSGGVYRGWRGKPLDPVLGDKILAWAKSSRSPGRIHWYIYKGRMVIYDYYGNITYNGPAPSGPADSDPGHWGHLHITYWE